MDAPQLDPVALSLTAVSSVVTFGLWAFVLVVTVRRWSTVRPGIRPALPLALGIAALQLPALVYRLLHLDVAELQAASPDMPASVASAALAAGAVAAVIAFAMGAFHHAVQVPVTVAAGREDVPFPLLTGAGKDRFSGWGVALALGAGGGAVSSLAFRLLGVQTGQPLEALLEELPEGPVLWGLLATSLVAAALAEELLFRGVMLRWLLRWLGDGRAAAVNAVLFTAVIWAFAHALNAEPMAPKLVQITSLGAGFGWLSLRHSVEAAMVGHLALNLTVLADAALFGLT